MGSLGCPHYRPLGRMNWAPVLGLCQEPERFTGPTYKSSFNPASWAWGVGLSVYFFKLSQFIKPFVVEVLSGLETLR